MEIKVVVAGCRDFEDYERAKEFITYCIKDVKNKKEIVFLSGGCRGADVLGERFAQEFGYKIKKYAADWSKYGRAAGPKRNEEMAKDCDFVICFWDGKSRGTKSMIELARKRNKSVKLLKI